MSCLQSTGPVAQSISRQIPTGKKVLPNVSVTVAAAPQDSDLNQQTYPTSPAHPMEEGEVLYLDTAMPEQELDQQVSDEQNYWETVRGVQSFMVAPGSKIQALRLISG